MKKITILIAFLVINSVHAMEDCPHWCAPEETKNERDIKDLSLCAIKAKRNSYNGYQDPKELNQQIQFLRDKMESADIYTLVTLNEQLKILQARQRQLLEE